MQLRDLKNKGIMETSGSGRKLSFLAGCVVGEELYFSAWCDKGFYKINLNTGHCMPLKLLDFETESMHLFSQALYYENSVWLIPCYGEHIVKITLDTFEVECIDLPREGREVRGKNGVQYGKFKCCYKEGASEFWLAPIGYNMLLKVDMHTKQVVEIDELRKKINFKEGEIQFSDACFVEDKIWLCPFGSEKLVIFDTLTDKLHFCEWWHTRENYRVIRNYERNAVFIPQTVPKDILLIDQDTFAERKIRIDVPWEMETDVMYLATDVVDRSVFMAPYQAHEFIMVDLKTGKVQVDKSLHNYVQDMSWGSEQYQVSIKYNTKRIYASDSEDMPLMVCDTKENEVFYIELQIDWKSYRNFLIGLCEKNEDEFRRWVNQKDIDVIFEKDLPLTLYCSEQERIKKRIRREENTQRTVGEKLFLNLK